MAVYSITVLCKTSVALGVGGFIEWDGEDLSSPDRHYAGEDWRFTKRVNDAGLKILHLPEKTWLWHHHGANTSGLPKNV